MSASAVLLAALAFAPAASAAWLQPVGGVSPINQVPSSDVQDPSLASVGGVPHVAWSENDGNNLNIRVARLNAGTDWVQPWFQIGGLRPTVTNTDGLVNQSVSQNGTSPSLTAVGNTPYVAWAETDTSATGSRDIRVARLQSTVNSLRFVQPWANDDDGGINFSQNEPASTPSLTTVGGVPWVAWTEHDGTNPEVRAARLNMSTNEWVQVSDAATPTTDGGINVDTTKNAFHPSIADVGGVPHIAWREFDASNVAQIRVARLNPAGTGWEEIVTGPSPINENASRAGLDPTLTSLMGVPYVAWAELDAQSGGNREIRVARLNAAGNDWVQPWGSPTDGGINHSTDTDGANATLSTIDGALYVAWNEDDEPGPVERWKLRVARLNPAGTVWDELVGGVNPINNDADLDAVTPAPIGVGGVPWVAWSEGNSGDQEIRASRLEPEFTSLTAVPSSTGATLVAGVKTFGVRYPVGFQFGPGFGSETPTQTTALGNENDVVTSEVTGLDPETTYQFRGFATAGILTPRVFGPTDSFTTLAAPVVPPGGGDPGTPLPDTIAALITNYGLSSTAFRAASGGASIAGRRRRIGTRVSYTLSEPANVTFTVQRATTGRTVRGRCVRQTRRNRTRRRCIRFVAVRGSFAHAGRTGANTFTFRGVMNRRKLAVGRYRLNARAVDAARNASPIARKGFRVVRR